MHIKEIYFFSSEGNKYSQKGGKVCRVRKFLLPLCNHKDDASPKIYLPEFNHAEKKQRKIGKYIHWQKNQQTPLLS